MKPFLYHQKCVLYDALPREYIKVHSSINKVSPLNIFLILLGGNGWSERIRCAKTEPRWQVHARDDTTWRGAIYCTVVVSAISRIARAHRPADLVKETRSVAHWSNWAAWTHKTWDIQHERFLQWICCILRERGTRVKLKFQHYNMSGTPDSG